MRQTTEDGAFIFLLEAVYKFAGIFFILRFPLLCLVSYGQEIHARQSFLLMSAIIWHCIHKMGITILSPFQNAFLSVGYSNLSKVLGNSTFILITVISHCSLVSKEGWNTAMRKYGLNLLETKIQNQKWFLGDTKASRKLFTSLSLIFKILFTSPLSLRRRQKHYFFWNSLSFHT